MFGLKARLGITMGAAILAAGFAVLPTNQALASGQSCQQQANGNLNTCAYVNGSGLHVNYFQGSVNNEGSGDQTNVHIELTGPHGLIQNCGTTTVHSLATIYCKWSPNANETAGNYCATSWQLASGKQIERGHACVDVHS
jgi:hypothetical protein